MDTGYFTEQISENCTSHEVINSIVTLEVAEWAGRLGEPESGRRAPLV